MKKLNTSLKFILILISILFLLTVGLMGSYITVKSGRTNAAIAEGSPKVIEKLAKTHQSFYSPAVVYYEKVVTNGNGTFRILKEHTAKQLIQVQGLQEITNSDETIRALSSLPTISKKSTIFYVGNEKIDNLVVGNQTVPLVRGTPKDIILSGQKELEKYKLIIVDDDTYNRIPVEEKSIGVFIFKFFENSTTSTRSIENKIQGNQKIFYPFTIQPESCFDIPQLYNLDETEATA